MTKEDIKCKLSDPYELEIVVSEIAFDARANQDLNILDLAVESFEELLEENSEISELGITLRDFKRLIRDYYDN